MAIKAVIVLIQWWETKGQKVVEKHKVSNRTMATIILDCVIPFTRRYTKRAMRAPSRAERTLMDHISLPAIFSQSAER